MSTFAHRILGDKYRLVHPLHKGGMGSVWLGEHLSLGSPIAVKLIATDVALTEERLSRFLREARAAAALRSPHVVQILDYGVDGGAPFIVMELLEGESLAHRLSRLGRLELGETARVIQHVSRAVAKAHDMGIVHRDLKPANIFITHNEEEEVIKIFDFGIAKGTVEGAIGTLANQTRTETFLGTPVYMSPEQFEGSRRWDFRTDIWAMGVITFECLLGHLPFVAPGIGGLVLDICSRPLPVPSEHGDVPAGFDAWFARACARKPDERFQSAREAAQELLRLLAPAVDEEAPHQPPTGAEGAAAAPDAWEPVPGERRDQGAPNRVPAAPLPPTTGAASIVTIERGRRRSLSRSLSLLASLMGLVSVIVALFRVVHWPVTTETVVQAIEPPRATAGLIALGDGSDLRLTVDGREIGALPQELQGMDPGEHSVMITGGDRYRPYRTTVMLSPGVVTSVGPVKLQVAKGLATVVPGSGAEGAIVTLESGGSPPVRLPQLPAQLDIEADEPHVLRAERAGYAPHEQALTFSDGQAERTFSVTLAELAEPPGESAARTKPVRRGRARLDRQVHTTRPAASAGRATLTLRSTPNAAVLLDGVPMGSTPLRDVTVTPGSHRVIFIHGAQRQARRVAVAARQNRVVSASFSTAPAAE